MVEPEETDPAPVTFAGGVLDRYRHVCAFVNSNDEETLVLDPFIRQGIETGDRLLFVVDTQRSGEPVLRLRHLGYDPAALLSAHSLEIRTWADIYLRGGRFDQDDALARLGRFLPGGARPRIRMWADMGWAAERQADLDALIEFEAKANFIHAHHENVVICTYDTARFDGAFVVDILRTHPMVLLGGVLQQNPYFVPPSDFLRERGQRGDETARR